MVCITPECPPVLVATFSFVVNAIIYVCMMCNILCCLMTCELGMVKDGVLVFTDCHFAIADARCFMEFLLEYWLM